MKDWGKFILLFLLCVATPLRPDVESATPLDQEEVQARIILNFPFVVTWSAATRQEEKTVICALDSSSLTEKLARTARDMGDALSVELRWNVSLTEARTCQVAILGSRDKAHIEQTLKALAGTSVLTVGHGKTFAALGGMIGLLDAEKSIGLFSEKQVRFEVNLRRAQDAGITLDPQLLELAERIIAR